MEKICLDKTINESLKFLKGQNEVPSCIEVVDYCGMPYSFGFKNSGKLETPIEHIGLAKLCYEEALKTFYTTRVNPDGSTQRVFEKLPEGSHIADCLNNLSADIFSWYKDSNGEPLKLTVFPEGIVQKPELINYQKYLDLDSQNIDRQNMSRVDVVDNAIKSAIQIYTSELVATGDVSEKEASDAKWLEEYHNLLSLSRKFQGEQQDENEDLEQ